MSKKHRKHGKKKHHSRGHGNRNSHIVHHDNQHHYSRHAPHPHRDRHVSRNAPVLRGTPGGGGGGSSSSSLQQGHSLSGGSQHPPRSSHSSSPLSSAATTAAPGSSPGTAATATSTPSKAGSPGGPAPQPPSRRGQSPGQRREQPSAANAAASGDPSAPLPRWPSRPVLLVRSGSKRRRDGGRRGSESEEQRAPKRGAPDPAGRAERGAGDRHDRDHEEDAGDRVVGRPRSLDSSADRRPQHRAPAPLPLAPPREDDSPAGAACSAGSSPPAAPPAARDLFPSPKPPPSPPPPPSPAAATAAPASPPPAPAAPDPFSSRKRRPERIEFVYPGSRAGEARPYPFGQTRKEDEEQERRKKEEASRDEAVIAISPSRVIVEAPDPGRPAPLAAAPAATARASGETLDDILYGRRKSSGADATVPDRSFLTPASSPPDPPPSIGALAPPPAPKKNEEESDDESEEEDEATEADRRPSDEVPSTPPGHLSGWSVERAVRDAAGCRPRANSTDGELNLPQRGLCDERAVLESYRWKLPGGVSPPRGFLNLGNTCFLNSTLQCLLYLPPFSQSLLSLSTTASDKRGTGVDAPTGSISSNGNRNGGKPNLGKRITHVLRSLFHQVLSGGEQPPRPAIAPQGIVRAIPTLGSRGSLNGYKFRPGRQEDAHEFLVHLLDAMNDGELREAGIDQHASGWRDRLPVPRLDETTFVHRIFGGYLRSQVQCVECQYRSNTYDPFLNLSLEVAGRSCSTLADAIGEFSRAETLDRNNRWKCSGCEKKVCATKQLTVFRPPLALCMQLKRFTYGGMGFGLPGGFSRGLFLGGGGGGKKITKPIDFPPRMDLPLSDGRSCAYSLTGLVIHVGGSASSGHYTAYVKRPGSHGQDQWYEVDDSFVQAVSERTVLQQRDAYLLFYCRQEVKLAFPTPPLRSSMTADEAKELGRSRARARAESMDQRVSDSAAPADTRADERAPGAPSDGPRVKSPPEKRLADAKQTASQDLKVAETANSLSTASEAEPVPQEHPKPHSGSPDGALLASRGVNSDENKEEASPSGSTSSSSSSSSSSSAATSSTGSSTSSDRRGHDDEAAAAMKQPQRTHESIAPIANADTTSAVPSTSKPESTSAPQSGSAGRGRTRIVVDRGAGRGKVEVMLEPRYKRAKVWKPYSSTPARDHGFGLLGNRQVGQWDDESPTRRNGMPSAPSATRADLERTEATKEKALKRKVFLDRWDSHLDQGKLKKVKAKERSASSYASDSTRNQFQKLQEHKVKHSSGL